MCQCMTLFNGMFVFLKAHVCVSVWLYLMECCQCMTLFNGMLSVYDFI